MNNAHEFNLDAAQREIDQRSAQGEDMSRAYVADDYSIRFKPVDEHRESIQIVADFAARSRQQYATTKKWTKHPDGSCETIRVPVALLNRIRDMAEAHGIQVAP